MRYFQDGVWWSQLLCDAHYRAGLACVSIQEIGNELSRHIIIYIQLMLIFMKYTVYILESVLVIA